MLAQNDYTSEMTDMLNRLIKRIAVNKTTSKSCVVAGQCYLYRFSEEWIQDELQQSSDVVVLRNMMDLMKFTNDPSQSFAMVGAKTSITFKALNAVNARTLRYASQYSV